MEDIVCVILAAGRGTRMQRGEKSQQKVLVKLQEKPMLGHVLEVIAAVGIKRVIVVIGHQGEQVKEYLKEWHNTVSFETVTQKNLLGTADAVRQTEGFLKNYHGDVLVLYGDTPLLMEKTLRHLLEEHRARKNDCTLVTTLIKNPTGYGRIVRDDRSKTVEKIVEEVDASLTERAIREINVGVYCFKAESLFEALKEVKPNNRKKEYYLTDTIALLSRKKQAVGSILSRDRHEVLGVNSPTDLAKARNVLGAHKNSTKSVPRT